ncbi:MAG: hypothetical protein JXA24_07330 [Proteobacteria bacterium]|nr:hypothetical protein [Pseudomonadota bacterium]
MAVEHALVLPAAVAIIVAVLGMAATGLRTVVAQHAAARAARVAAVFNDGLIGAELHASLAPSMFSAHSFDVIADAGGTRLSNEMEGILTLEAVSGAALSGGAAGSRSVVRKSPATPALPEGLGERVLRGGDTPSPYCRTEGGYSACGWPE